MNNISYKKLNLVALGAIIVNIIMYFGFIFVYLFTNVLSNNEYALLIVMAVILVVSILGLLSGGVSFFNIRKVESNNIAIPKTDIVLTILSVIINFVIAIYSFMNLSLIFYFIRA